MLCAERCSWFERQENYWVYVVGDSIDNTVRVVRSITLLTNRVTPVLVTGVHFSTMHNVCGTMDTGDKRRFDPVGI